MTVRLFDLTVIIAAKLTFFSERLGVIFQTRVGVLPPISKYRETSLKRGEAEFFELVSRYFEIGGRTLNECLKLPLQGASILGENSAVIFLRFLNTD